MSEEIEYNQLKILMECKGDLTDPNKYVKDLKNLSEKIESNPEFKKIIKINKSISERNRLLILELLRENEEMCICELTFALDLSQQTISHHLQKLEDAKLIEGIKSGKFIHYRLKKTNIKNYLEIFKKFIKD